MTRGDIVAAQHARPPGHPDLLFEVPLNFLGRRGGGAGEGQTASVGAGKGIKCVGATPLIR